MAAMPPTSTNSTFWWVSLRNSSRVEAMVFSPCLPQRAHQLEGGVVPRDSLGWRQRLEVVEQLEVEVCVEVPRRGCVVDGHGGTIPYAPRRGVTRIGSGSLIGNVTFGAGTTACPGFSSKR